MSVLKCVGSKTLYDLKVEGPLYGTPPSHWMGNMIPFLDLIYIL